MSDIYCRFDDELVKERLGTFNGPEGFPLNQYVMIILAVAWAIWRVRKLVRHG